MEKTSFVGFAAMALSALVVALPQHAARAAVKGQTVAYKQGDAVLDGYLAYNGAAKGKEPGIVVFTDWYGMTGYAEARARRLAGLGYVVLVADVYGKGLDATTDQMAGAHAGKLAKDPALLAARDAAAFDLLRDNARVNDAKLVTMGYCFGGLSAFGLARSGADLVATITFHGEVRDRDPASAKNIKGHVLAFWGANDPHVTAKDMDAFEDEMRATKVDWQVVTFANTVHSFTVPTAHSATDAYSPIADRRSWQEMRDFLHEVLR